MRTIYISLIALLVLAAKSKDASAISLPDSSSCSAAAGAQCLKITNTNAASNGNAIIGVTSNAGIAVEGIATGTAIGVGAGSAGGFAVSGVSSGNTGGFFQSTSSTGNGVYAAASAGGTGSAVFGAAGGSFTAWAGNFDGDTQARGYYNSSDARLKKDIVDMPQSLARILKLRPVTYRWKSDGAERPLQLGLIAQEVQKIAPEVIRTDAKTGMLSINYVELLPVVIKAVQEQQAVIRQQDARIAALERERAPVTSSLFSGGLGGGLAAGLIPLGLIVAFRRNRKRQD